MRVSGSNWDVISLGFRYMKDLERLTSSYYRRFMKVFPTINTGGSFPYDSLSQQRLKDEDYPRCFGLGRSLLPKSR